MKVVKIRRSGYVGIAGIVLGIIAIWLVLHNNEKGRFLLYIAGALMVLSSLLFLIPIFFAPKDADGNARLVTDSKILRDKPVKEKAAESAGEHNQVPRTGKQQETPGA